MHTSGPTTSIAPASASISLPSPVECPLLVDDEAATPCLTGIGGRGGRPRVLRGSDQAGVRPRSACAKSTLEGGEEEEEEAEEKEEEEEEEGEGRRR